jgi:hypothetical protein
MNSRQRAKQSGINEQRKGHRRRQIMEWAVAFVVGIAATLVSQKLLGW